MLSVSLLKTFMDKNGIILFGFPSWLFQSELNVRVAMFLVGLVPEGYSSNGGSSGPTTNCPRQVYSKGILSSNFITVGHGPYVLPPRFLLRIFTRIERVNKLTFREKAQD